MSFLVRWALNVAAFMLLLPFAIGAVVIVVITLQSLLA